MTRAVDELERRLFQLETLYEIGRECAGLDTQAGVVHVILSMVMGAFGAVRGVAFVGGPDGQLAAFDARGLGSEERSIVEAWARASLRTSGPVAGPTVPDEVGLEVYLPIEVEATTRGAVALGPRLTGSTYSADDRALLRTIVANAAPYLRNVVLLQALRVAANDLARRVQALAVSNEIALGMASRPTTPRLHRFLLERVARALGASEGALRLDAEDGPRLAAHYVADPDRGVSDPELRLGLRGNLDDGLEDGRELRAQIRYGDQDIGALWLRRDPAAEPFDADDRAVLEFLATQGALILENSRLLETFLLQQQEQFRLRGMLEQYLAPSVAERLITGETRPALEGSRLLVSVLMVDMRRSTELINHVEPEVMVQLLNQYLGRMTDVLFRFEGTVDKFTGDAVLGFFGAPEGHPDDPLRAVRAAAEMQREFAGLLDAWSRRHSLPAALGIGVGVATGEVVVGNIGSAKRLEHTVIGWPVNLAARLSAKAPAGAIFVDEATWLGVAGHVRTPTGRRRPRYVRAKGFSGLVTVFRLCATDLPPMQAGPR